MNNRTIVRATSFAICFVAVISVYAIKGNVESRRYQARLEASYQSSLMELAECLDLIETNLTKSAYAATPTMMARLSEDLFSECNTAKNALSNLPIEQMRLSGAYKFISQAADYAEYLSSKIRNGDELSDEELKNMNTLLSYAKSYSKSVSDMVSKCANGNKITENEIKTDNSGYAVSSLSLDFTQAEEAFADYPTLIYDGPFADAVLNRESTLLKSADSISREKAIEIMCSTFNASPENLKMRADEVGNAPCYVFSLGSKTVGITKNGGYIAYIMNSETISTTNITVENAKNLAKSFLEKAGYKNMKSTYYATEGNVCIINFVYTSGNIVYYPDLIKVGVSLSNGKIYSLEAVGYLMNHIDRAAATQEISLNDAQLTASKRAEVISSGLAVIPLRNGKEAECYEFLCRNKKTGEDILIYINTKTGEEEDILMLLYSDNGTLTK